MIDQLKSLVQKYAGDAVVNNPDIPNDKNEEVIGTASNSIFGGLQQALSQGGIKDLLKMFTGGNSQVGQQVSGGLIQDLIAKFGLNASQATTVADKMVPNVLNEMVEKTNDPGDSSFDLQGIFNQLSNGQTSGFNVQDIFNKVKGGKLDLDGDGDTDMQDLMSLFKPGGMGNLTDKVKSFFG